MEMNARHQYEHYRHCYDNGHQEYLVKAHRCFEFWRGNQWDAADRAALAAAHRPALTFNIVESLVRAMKGMQRALRNDVMFAPLQDATTESAQVMDAIWLYVQHANKFDHLEGDVYEKGLIMGRSYYDVRMNFESSLQGDLEITSPRSQDIILDPSVDAYDPYTWPRVFRRRWVSYQDLVTMFGRERAEPFRYPTNCPSWFDYEDQFMSQQMGRMPYFTNALPEDNRKVRGMLLLEQQQFDYRRKPVFLDVLTGDFSEIPENWDNEKIGRVLELAPDTVVTKRDMKTVRWTSTVEDRVMHDSDSPYKRFTIVPYFPSFVDGVDMGAVESLLDPQVLYNKVSSQELHIINTTANSGYKLKTGSLQNMTVEELEERGAKTGVVIELKDVNDLEKITPNQVPQGHDRISNKADSIMRNIAGVSNQGRGFAREDVAGEAILANQAAQDINAASWMSNLYRSKQLMMDNVQDCVSTWYNEPRTFIINRGTTYRPDFQNLSINQTVEGRVLNDVSRGKYTTTLVPSPSRATMSEADFKMLLELRKLGIGIPDELLIELSPAANKGKIIQMLQGDSNERQAQAEQAAAQAQLVDLQKGAAQAQQAQAAAVLSQARAEKAATEAATDPDAAYVQVETDRLGIEQQRVDNDFQLGLRQLAFDQRKHSDDVALKRDQQRNDMQMQREQSRQSAALQLTKIDSDRQTAREGNQLKEKVASRATAKPAAKTAAKNTNKPKKVTK